MNVLPDNKIAIVQGLILSGHSVREISKLAGVSRLTVQRYRGMIKVLIKCECGKDAKHKGWCSHRYGRSPARQAFIMKWTGAKSTYPKWVVKASCDLGRPLSEFDALLRTYMMPCRLCGVNKIPCGWLEMRVCGDCQRQLEVDYQDRKQSTRYRIRYRAFRKKMAEIGRLITTARKLIHENNE